MLLEDKAAIYLEECGISGDTMIERDMAEEGGSMYLHDLLANFAAQHCVQLTKGILRRHRQNLPPKIYPSKKRTLRPPFATNARRWLD